MPPVRQHRNPKGFERAAPEPGRLRTIGSRAPAFNWSAHGRCRRFCRHRWDCKRRVRACFVYLIKYRLYGRRRARRGRIRRAHASGVVAMGPPCRGAHRRCGRPVRSRGAPYPPRGCRGASHPRAGDSRGNCAAARRRRGRDAAAVARSCQGNAAVVGLSRSRRRCFKARLPWGLACSWLCRIAMLRVAVAVSRVDQSAVLWYLHLHAACARRRDFFLGGAAVNRSGTGALRGAA